jgi:hypothetical protein
MKVARIEQKPTTKDDVVASMMNMVGQTLTLDEKSTELFKQLAEQVLDGNSVIKK